MVCINQERKYSFLKEANRKMAPVVHKMDWQMDI